MSKEESKQMTGVFTRAALQYFDAKKVSVLNVDGF